MKRHDEEGMVAIWTALVLLFLIGSVALAADTSGFFRMARADQTSADLACLAGAQELPGSPSTALTIAAENAKTNFPRVASATPVLTSNQATLTVGGNVVTINTNWSGDSKKMRVEVTSSEQRTFSRIWSSADVPVRQQAICTATPGGGPGMVPVASVSGTFDEDLFDCAENKNNGNCGALESGTGASGWSEALANGLVGQFEKHWGTWTSNDPDTGNPGLSCPKGANGGYTFSCNAIWPESGNMVGKFNSGLAQRMTRQVEGYCPNPNFNCDSLGQIISGVQTPATVQTLFQAFGASRPSFFNEQVYGPYAAAMNDHYYWDADIKKCDSPRLATIPIVSEDKDWAPGDPAGDWVNGNSNNLKIVGFYTVYIREPNTAGENGIFQADVVWFGDNATCDGEEVDFYGAIGASKKIKLVAS